MTFVLKKCFLISESHYVLQNPVKHFEKKSGIKILTSLCSGDWELFKSEASCIQLELCVYLKHQTLHFLLKVFIIFPRRLICVKCASGEVRVLKVRTMASETQAGLLQVDLPQRPSPGPGGLQPVPPLACHPRVLCRLPQTAGLLGPTVPALTPKPPEFPRGESAGKRGPKTSPWPPLRWRTCAGTLLLEAFIA